MNICPFMQKQCLQEVNEPGKRCMFDLLTGTETKPIGQRMCGILAGMLMLSKIYDKNSKWTIFTEEKT